MPVVEEPISPCLLIGEGKKKAEVPGALMDLEVEEHHELASVFRIRLAIVREADGRWNFLDEETAAPWAQIAINMRVKGKEQELIAGYITQVRVHFDPAEGNSYLELVGMDSSCVMNVEEVIKDWPEMRDSAIAEAIFRKYALDARVEDTGVDHPETGSTIIQRETDIQFLKRLARRNGCECVINGKSAVFAKPDLKQSALPELAAHFGEETSLTSFDASVNALRPTAVAMQHLDTASKQVETSEIEASAIEKLGEDGPPSLANARPRTYVRHQVVTGSQEARQLTEAIADEASWFVEARGEVDAALYGDLLRARRRVPIKGVGKMLSGMYYVTSVRHVYSADRYVQHFTARRNATTVQPKDFGAGLKLPF
jgi:phage protein D